jgi:hypothetical protein
VRTLDTYNILAETSVGRVSGELWADGLLGIGSPWRDAEREGVTRPHDVAKALGRTRSGRAASGRLLAVSPNPPSAAQLYFVLAGTRESAGNRVWAANPNNSYSPIMPSFGDTVGPLHTKQS